MIDYSRYYRAYAEMKDTLDGDFAREYIVSAMADADQGNDELSGNAYNRVIDMEWVEMIEGKLPYIEKAIEEQRKFIEEHKEVDRIDKVKQVDKEAVQHLTQHANLIMAIEPDGNVIPERLLNTHREDSFATYENRFLHTLIFRTIDFVEARFRSLQDAPNDSASQMHMERELTLGHEHFGFTFDHHAEKHEREKIDRDEDLSGLTDFERIERIRMKFDDFVGTDLIKALKGCIAVKSPINKTNCIKQDPAFKQCYDLWVFIEGYRKTGYVLEKNVFEGQMPENVQKDMYDVMALQHFVATMNTNTALRRKLHAEYLAENERRAAEANRPEEEIQRYIDDKIFEVRREEMAIRLKEVREREVIIAKLNAELEQAKEQIRIRDIKIKELESVINALKKDLEAVREELRQAQVRIMDLEKEVEELKAYIEELEAKIAQLEARIRELEAQVAAHLATIASLQARIGELEAYITRLQSEIEQLKGIVAEQAKQIAAHEATIAAQSNEILDLNNQVTGLNRTVSNLSNENTALKADIDNKKRIISDQADDIAAKSSAIAAANAANEKLTGEFNSLRSNYEETVAQNASYLAEMKVLNNTIAEDNSVRRDLEHQIRVHVNTISAKDAIISTLNTEKSLLSEKIDGINDREAKADSYVASARDKVAEYENENAKLNDKLRKKDNELAGRDETISAMRARIDEIKAEKDAEIAAVRAEYEQKLSGIQSQYEIRIDSLENEKVAACTFSDDQKYAVRLDAERRTMQKEYDKKLAVATKKARKFVRKARVLVSDNPQALLKLEETKDYI